MRLLIADDDAEMRSWLKLALRPLGGTVEEVTNGSSLLMMLTEGGPFNLVITDVRMPSPSGLDVAAAARQLGVATPFIVITAFGDGGTRRKVNEIRGAVLLDKPFEADALREHANRLLGRGGSKPPR